MKYLSYLLKISILGLFVLHISCRKDFDTIPSNGMLRFSSDTLFLDTVFNNLTTKTNVLTVYNKSREDVLIPNIQLQKVDSKYRLNVDGIPGTDFENVLILAKDSLFIWVETTVDTEDDDLIYTDKILFDTQGNTQDVDLLTLVKKATLLYADSGSEFQLSQTTFTNQQPYVIFGNAVIPKNKSLEIASGTTVYFSKDSRLTVSEGATLTVNGTLNDSVVFRGSELSYVYDQIPGQWQGIELKKNAKATINYLQILNPTIGIDIIENQQEILIQNTEIYNAGKHSIQATNANVKAENLVLGQAQESNLKLQGGLYTFLHCTFANYWNKGNRFDENIYLRNYYLDANFNEIEASLQRADFVNCIIAGSKNTEIEFDKHESFSNFNFSFTNCMINLEKGTDFFNTNNTSYYTNCLFQPTFDFRNTSINDLRIGLKNEGIDKANITTAQQVPTDILGTNRTTNADIGAYQHIDFKTLEPQKDDE
ncbi:hypothetical protein [Ochrovirga pacifica]|uniref:hypothetical protein n=1 Tax=Ochrovirga pacifica TaxID=1042376 RepID=UPI0003077534|nr:hypothetical protein [Ochrovirga pacifica]